MVQQGQTLWRRSDPLPPGSWRYCRISVAAIRPGSLDFPTRQSDVYVIR